MCVCVCVCLCLCVFDNSEAIINLIEVGYIKYGNFENCKFDSDLKSKI